MKTILLAASLLLAVSSKAAAESWAAPAPSPEASTPPPATLPLRARLTDQAIKQAVRETLAENRGRRVATATGDVFSGDPYRKFSRDFAEAQKPSCLGPNALKHQPARFSTKNWNFNLDALFAVPFWAAAVAKGKCN